MVMGKLGRAAAILVLVAAVAGLGYYGVERANRSRANADDSSLVGDLAAPPDQRMVRPATLLVIGDSFAGGNGDPNIVTYPTVLGERFGWNVRVDAVGGSGFVSKMFEGRKIPSVGERLAQDRASFDADYIVIDAGRNDLGVYPSEVIPEIERYVADVHKAWPDAKIVMIKPAYATTKVAENYPMLSEAFDRVGAQNNALVVDPVAEGWFNVENLDSLLYSDKVHLSNEGHKYYADRIADAIQRAGLATPLGDRSS